MRAKSLKTLQAEAPGKFAFSFVVGAPNSSTPMAVYQGVLPVEDLRAAEQFVKRFQKLLLNFGAPGTTIIPALPKRRPPKGMVAISKSKAKRLKLSGEESE